MLMIMMTMVNIMRMKMRTIHDVTNGSQIKAKLVMMITIELRLLHKIKDSHF